mmetsp:Transcript_52558/g.162566  ORF Transcript_52558/g.162566 Transcript_52558/m.162566 type:complete len:231 (-) Transcript_52558:744-1436(-)
MHLPRPCSRHRDLRASGGPLRSPFSDAHWLPWGHRHCLGHLHCPDGGVRLHAALCARLLLRHRHPHCPHHDLGSLPREAAGREHRCPGRGVLPGRPVGGLWPVADHARPHERALAAPGALVHGPGRGTARLRHAEPRLETRHALLPGSTGRAGETRRRPPRHRYDEQEPSRRICPWPGAAFHKEAQRLLACRAVVAAVAHGIACWDRLFALLREGLRLLRHGGLLAIGVG